MNRIRTRRGRLDATIAAGMAVLATAYGIAVTGNASAEVAAAKPNGVDVASYQAGFNWSAAAAQGIPFAYVKATEGVTYRNPQFAAQYNGSYRAGMIRGSYHYARPHRSSGAAQAEFFVRNGGGWSRDGRTLPGALDLENSAGVEYCYGKSPAQMRSWIHDFVNRYHELTGRWAVIYTRTNWWNPCTGNDTTIAANSPLWLARFGPAPGELPAGWRVHSFWQRGLWNNVDFNTWNGSYEQLRVMACNGPC